jgi:toxin ParE1/3/4
LIKSSRGVGPLADHPRLGEARQEIAPEARMLAIGNYLVLYRIVEPDIDIVRIAHGARQVEGIFDSVKGLDED